MPATEPTNDASKSSSGAQQAQGDEVPPELMEGSDGKVPTSGKDVVSRNQRVTTTRVLLQETEDVVEELVLIFKLEAWSGNGRACELWRG